MCVCRASSFSCLTTDAIIALATHLPSSPLCSIYVICEYINVLLYRVHHGHHFISLYFVCVCNVIVFLLIHISHLFIFFIFYCCCQGGMFLTGAALHYRISISFCYRLLERERKPDNRLKKQNEKKNPDCILYFWAYLNMSKERKTTCRIHVVDVISLSVPDEHNDPFILFWEKKNRKTTFLTMELCRRIKTVYIIYAEFPIKDLGILFVAVGHDRHETVGRPSSFNYNDFNRFYWGFFLSCLWILSRLFYWYVVIPPPPNSVI